MNAASQRAPMGLLEGTLRYARGQRSTCLPTPFCSALSKHGLCEAGLRGTATTACTWTTIPTTSLMLSDNQQRSKTACNIQTAVRHNKQTVNHWVKRHTHVTSARPEKMEKNLSSRRNTGFRSTHLALLCNLFLYTILMVSQLRIFNVVMLPACQPLASLAQFPIGHV